MNIIGEMLGYWAGLSTAIFFLPQTVKTLQEKKVDGLSASSYAIYCFGVLCWILYGWYLHSIQMMIFNTISLAFALPLLVMILKNKRK